jgi:plastocyanin
MRTALLIACLAASAAARAETLNGSIDDPGLRRKTQLVYVETVPGKFTPPAEPAVMNQIGNTYSPRVLTALAGQKIEFRSQDPELHNVYARAGKSVLFNQAVLPKKMFDKVVDQPGVVHLSCNIHKEMSADIVVLQNPYLARPDASGKFTIENLPAGTYTLRIFGSELSDEQKARKFTVTVGGAPVKLG